MKRIDPKYHIETFGPREEIVKTSNYSLIPDDEPLILFRGRDRLALVALEAYRAACVADGCTPYQLAGIDNRIDAFREFAKREADRMKQPGCTLGQ